MTVPGYWMHETSGVLRPAILAYLSDDVMTPAQIAAVRAYLRQWMENGEWRGPEIQGLTFAIDALVSREAISLWLVAAEKIGIDPL